MGEFMMRKNIFKQYGFVLRKLSVDDLSDPFFDSFKSDYQEFSDWYKRKCDDSDKAYYFYDGDRIIGFIKLKKERNHILKISSLKLTEKSKRFADDIFKCLEVYALKNNVKLIYATCFPRHEKLVNKFLKFGYKKFKKMKNGEFVLYKRI